MTAAATLRARLSGRAPRLAIVLGSGLGGLTDALSDPVTIPFADLPGFPASGVSGHAGALVAGALAGVPVILLSGRVHYYEQGDAAAMRVPLETLKAAGIERLVLTNAAGSLRQDLPPGSAMLITDHINWSGLNPLIGEGSDARFVGMTAAYDPAMTAGLRDAATAAGESLGEGVYMWFSGPSFETPAEIRAARLLGADAVGMSTVPEVILARFLGLRVAGLSAITNYGAGLAFGGQAGELSHQDTKDVAPRAGRVLAAILRQWLATEGGR